VHRIEGDHGASQVLHREQAQRTAEILEGLRLVLVEDPTVQIPMAELNERAKLADVTKRRLLIDMLLRRFADLGWQATRVEDITTAASVAKGTFYLYFRTKDELIEALRDQFVRHMLELAVEAAAALDPEDPWELVDAYTAHVINYELDESDLYDLLIQEGGGSVAGEEECIAILSSALESGAETGTFEVPAGAVRVGRKRPGVVPRVR
jgi:AcrR family transcriptional regulator